MLRDCTCCALTNLNLNLRGSFESKHNIKLFICINFVGHVFLVKLVCFYGSFILKVVTQFTANQSVQNHCFLEFQALKMDKMSSLTK